TQLYFIAFFRLKFKQCGARPEHGAADVGGAVFEGEIPMPGGRTGQIGNFTFHPHAGKCNLEQLTGALSQRTDGKKRSKGAHNVNTPAKTGAEAASKPTRMPVARLDLRAATTG